MRSVGRQIDAVVPAADEDVVGPWLRPLVRFLEAAGGAADGVVRVWELEVLGRLGDVTVYRHTVGGGFLNIGADGWPWRYVGDGSFERHERVADALSALEPAALRLVR
jgi:hypothetical protein